MILLSWDKLKCFKFASPTVMPSWPDREGPRHMKQGPWGTTTISAHLWVAEALRVCSHTTGCNGMCVPGVSRKASRDSPQRWPICKLDLKGNWYWEKKKEKEYTPIWESQNWKGIKGVSGLFTRHQHALLWHSRWKAASTSKEDSLEFRGSMPPSSLGSPHLSTFHFSGTHSFPIKPAV